MRLALVDPGVGLGRAERHPARPADGLVALGHGCQIVAFSQGSIRGFNRLQGSVSLKILRWSATSDRLAWLACEAPV